VPSEYRWASNLISGIDGDIEKGRKELEEVVNYAKNNKFVFDDETHLVYAFTLLYLGNQGEEAWNVMKNSHLKPEKSVLAALAMANVGMKTGHSAEVIQIVQNAPRTKSYYNVPLLNYFLGVAKLNLLDDDAKQELTTFVKNAKGKTGIKEAYQKLGWFELIHGNESGYWSNIQMCKTQGGTTAEGDKAANREAKSGQKPEPNLLKARLLFDGGQYERALQSLQGKSINDFSLKQYQLEYSYRLGRIYHKLNRIGEAANLYQQTINDGKNEEYMYACNAAFQLGSIYEQKNEWQQAKNYYNLCLSMSPSEYANGLHQKAKAGLNRIGQ
jgi:tetratricopeptide (TPR) repeat protein